MKQTHEADVRPQQLPPQLLVALAVMTALLLLGVGGPTDARSDSGEPSVLFLGNQSLPPMTYLENGKPAGIVIDLTEAMAQRMHHPLQLQLMNWSDAQQRVLAGRADALVQMNANPERLASYDFSEPLLTSEFTIFTAADRPGIQSKHDLPGLRVGVEQSGLPILLMKEDPRISIEIIPDYLKGFAMLTTGQIDAVVADRWVGCYLLAEHNIRGVRFIEEPISTSHSAIAVAKGNTGLLTEINAALADIRRDGTYGRIMERWRAKEIVFKTREQVRQQTWTLVGILAVLVVTLFGFLLQVREIRRRKQAEAELVHQSDLRQRIFNSTDAHLVVLDGTGQILEVNDAWCRFARHNGGDDSTCGPGASYFRPSRLDADDTESADVAYQGIRLVQQGLLPSFEIEYPCHTPQKRVYYHMRVRPLLDRPGMVLISHMDITERKLAQELLQASEARLQRALEAAKAGVWEWDIETGGNYWSNELYRLYDLDPQQHTASYQTWQQTILPQDWGLIEKTVQETTADSRDLKLEWRVKTADGSLRWLMSRGQPQRDATGRATSYLGTTIDITELKQAEEALRQSEERLNFALQVSHTGGWNLDLKDRTAHHTAEHDRIFGYEQPLPTWSYEQLIAHVVAEDRAGVEQSFHQAVTEKTAWNFECRIRRVDGEVRWIWAAGGHLLDTVGQTDRMAGIIQDITGRKQAEKEQEDLQAQYVQAQKMESVGRLAGGVAHDFNNMLGVILGHTELVMDQLQADHAFLPHLQAISKAADHSSTLTRQLLTFARKQVVAPEVIDLNHNVEGMLKLLHRLIGENIDLAWSPGHQLGKILIDPSQIDQILANLCINARDAIADTGKITIETDNVTFDQIHPGPSKWFLPGSYALLSVSDNGCGMEAETMDHIFEPFYTTKEIGKGTGLGLATVYGIIKQNKGAVDVQSAVGQGTTFKIYLPLHRDNEISAAQTSSPEFVEGGNETILLVEDDALILRMTAIMLERLGYNVVTAETPYEALKIAQEQTEPIHLVITDVVMPDMNGRELTERLLSICPDLRCLLMSGYTADIIAHHGVFDEGVQFISKPFAKKDLATKIRSVLA